MLYLVAPHGSQALHSPYPHPEACSPGQIFGPETTSSNLLYCGLRPCVTTPALGRIWCVILGSSAWFASSPSPYPHPRQGQDNEREWGPAFSRFRSKNLLENNSPKFY